MKPPPPIPLGLTVYRVAQTIQRGTVEVSTRTEVLVRWDDADGQPSGELRHQYPTMTDRGDGARWHLIGCYETPEEAWRETMVITEQSVRALSQRLDAARQRLRRLRGLEIRSRELEDGR